MSSTKKIVAVSAEAAHPHAGTPPTVGPVPATPAHLNFLCRGEEIMRLYRLLFLLLAGVSISVLTPEAMAGCEWRGNNYVCGVTTAQELRLERERQEASRLERERHEEARSRLEGERQQIEERIRAIDQNSITHESSDLEYQRAMEMENLNYNLHKQMINNMRN